MQLERLRLVNSQPEKQPQKKNAPRTGKVSAKTERSGSMELDIRGCTCDDGVYQMDAFLDRTVLSHVSTVTIIHGKGTGLLRKAVHQRLKQLKYVKSFRLGAFGEGEDGVTIVTLASYTARIHSPTASKRRNFHDRNRKNVGRESI